MSSLALGLTALGMCHAALSGQGREPARVPLVAGLTIIGAVSHPAGDAEVLLRVQSVTPEAYRMTFSFEAPDPAGGTQSATAVRRVLMHDQRTARTMRNWYGENDPETFPGTTPFFSAAIINDLRRDGRAALTLLVATSAATRDQTAVQALSGTVSRIESTPLGVPVLVNGRLVELPALHVRADVGSGAMKRSADVYVLDDPDNPIILRWRDESRNSKILKLDFPVAESLERDLTERRSTEVYGIYFGFASAAIRPESERVLKEIADALQRHPDWKLRIDGHTDGIGSEAANLELSKQRAAAVRDALLARFKVVPERLSTGGKGEASPKGSNDTPEGRAQNRRVELTRQ